MYSMSILYYVSTYRLVLYFKSVKVDSEVPWQDVHVNEADGVFGSILNPKASNKLYSLKKSYDL